MLTTQRSPVALPKRKPRWETSTAQVGVLAVAARTTSGARRGSIEVNSDRGPQKRRRSRHAKREDTVRADRPRRNGQRLHRPRSLPPLRNPRGNGQRLHRPRSLPPLRNPRGNDRLKRQEASRVPHVMPRLKEGRDRSRRGPPVGLPKRKPRWETSTAQVGVLAVAARTTSGARRGSIEVNSDRGPQKRRRSRHAKREDTVRADRPRRNGQRLHRPRSLPPQPAKSSPQRAAPPPTTKPPTSAKSKVSELPGGSLAGRGEGAGGGRLGLALAPLDDDDPHADAEEDDRDELAGGERRAEHVFAAGDVAAARFD